MELNEKVHNEDTLILSVHGDLVTYIEIDKLRGILTTRVHKNMIIDLENVSRLSSLAIAIMIIGFRQSDAREGKFILCKAPSDVLLTLKSMGLEEVFIFVQSEEEAIALIEE